MKPRVYLPVSIAVAGIAGFALVFCHRDGEEAEKKQPDAGKLQVAQQRPPPATTFPKTPIAAENKKPPEKLEPEKVLTPEEDEKEAKKKVVAMFRMMIAMCLDNGGLFPSDSSALLSANLGFPVNEAGEWLRHVIEYRGRGLTSSDDGSFLLMRYRIGDRTDKELRLHVSGSIAVVPSDTPIPEDLPVSESQEGSR